MWYAECEAQMAKSGGVLGEREVSSEFGAFWALKMASKWGTVKMMVFVNRPYVINVLFAITYD